MSTTIIDTIRHLLMEENQVCLPGLGTLRLQPQPALISPMESKALPPSELVTFNANLVLDDGRIVAALERSGQYSHAEASKSMEEFIRNMRENLDAGRSFTLDGIGRFFKHHNKQLKFTPAGDNFSKESFGLPGIELRPIVRTEKQRRSAVDPILANPSTPGEQGSISTGRVRKRDAVLYHPELLKALWYVAAFLFILLVFAGIYQLVQFSFDKAPETTVMEAPRLPSKDIPANRFNVSPVPSTVDAKTVRPQEPPRLGDDRINKKPTSLTPPTSAPLAPVTPTAPATTPSTPAQTNGKNIALIATGLFGSQRNVNKNTDRIEAAGFVSFSEPDGRYTRIGVRLEYRTEEELQDAVERVQRLFSDAFILKVNGEVLGARN
ncbi:MAG: nucleoid DNA-binding protein [Neolewinella sp.]|jgi:nucleoid DNA-binding protein